MEKKCMIIVTILLLVVMATPIKAIGQIVVEEQSTTYLYNAIKSETDPISIEKMLVQMEKQSASEPRDAMILDAGRYIAAKAYAHAGDAQKANYWMNKINNKSWKTSSLSTVTRALIEAGMLNDAEELVKPFLGQTGSNNFHYGLILYKRKEFKAALEYLKPNNEDKSDFLSADAEIYPFALIEADKQLDAFNEVNRLLKISANRSDRFKDASRKLFQNKYGDEIRYEFLLDSMETVDHNSTLTKIAKMETNQLAPDFELKDLNGKSVSLKSLKGKIVILDFWATWCQPCIASFPGMQKAVDYYKNDDSVVFMFIHTQEKSPNAADDAKKMLIARGNRFDVYMDLKDEVLGKSPVSAAYKISGLTAKFFIDKNGFIRYKNVGYIGVDEAIPEIKTIVDKLKAE